MLKAIAACRNLTLIRLIDLLLTFSCDFLSFNYNLVA